MKSILDPKFRYVHSTKTDIRATFRRIRREQAEQAAQAPVVVPIKLLTNKTKG